MIQLAMQSYVDRSKRYRETHARGHPGPGLTTCGRRR